MPVQNITQGHYANTMQDTTQTLRKHTISSIAEAQGYKKRAAQGWLAKAREKYGELGEIVDGTRFYSDDERAKILEFASERKGTI